MTDIYAVTLWGSGAEVSSLMMLSPGAAAALQDASLVLGKRAKEKDRSLGLDIKPLVEVSDLDREDLLGSAGVPIELHEAPPWAVVAHYAHLHIDGKCRKNRFAPQCTAW